MDIATAPDRHRHGDAHAVAKQAHDDLHHHQLSRMLRPDKSSELLVQRAAALLTWRHWADGEPVAAAQLADAVAQLRTAVPGDPAGHLRQLCELVRLISPEITAVQPNIAPPLRPSGPTLSL